MGRQLFHLVMIKPSHYDDDGYPIVWFRSAIPSNTLAAVHGVALDCAARKALGEDVELRLHAYDETNTRIRPERIIRELKKAGGQVLIALVGVQSNQFPRALDIARPFRAAGLQVAIGGFHVSGCLSMLPELTPELQQALDMGLSLFAGECEEGRLDEVLQDARAGTLKPIYNHLDDLPGIAGQPIPFLTAESIQRNFGRRSSLDLGRGCPFQCSFCTIINVQGRKSRFRTTEDLERIVRTNAAQGVSDFFVTDDNFARNKDWEAFFDCLIRLRKDEGLKVSLILQVDTLCHRIPHFIDKAAEAGTERVFIGLENINPDNLIAAKKRQNRITEYRHMIQQWRDHGVLTTAGYITGFPADTKERVLRDVEIIKRELPLDVLEFFFLTPLPGSEDHQVLYKRGEWMDPDLNKYNLHHAVSHHSKMSGQEWAEAYDGAWRNYFTWEHIETVARRHAARRKGGRLWKALEHMVQFKSAYEIEGLQALECGVLRRKHRRDRRPGMPMESPLVFYPRFWTESAVKAARYLGMFLKARAIRRKVLKDPNRFAYTDIAIQPVDAADLDTLEMFTETSGGVAAVEKQRRQDVIIGRAEAPAQA